MASLETLFGTSNIFYTSQNQIPFVERPGFQEVWADDQTAFTRRLCCLWSDAAQFRRDLLGNDEYVTGDAIITRTLPYEDEEYGGFYPESFTLAEIIGQQRKSDMGQYATYVNSDPSTFSGGLPVEGSALLAYDVVFRKPLYDVKPDEDIESATGKELNRFVIRLDQDAIEGLPLPTGFLKRSDTDETVGAQVDLLFPKTTYMYRWYRVPIDAFPKTTIRGLEGKVNSVAFDTGTGGNNIAANKGLFLGFNKRFYQGRNGVNYFDVDFQIEFRPRGYQVLPMADGNFVECYRANDPAVKIFETGDFHNLFDPSLG